MRQLNEDAVIAAIEEQTRKAHDMATMTANGALIRAIAAIRALPASNARVEAGDAMKAALQRYGRHNVGCRFDPYGDTEERIKTCTCGFMKALDIVGDGP